MRSEKPMHNVVATLASTYLIGSSSFFCAGNKDMNNSLDEFEFQPDLTTDYRASCP